MVDSQLGHVAMGTLEPGLEDACGRGDAFGGGGTKVDRLARARLGV